MSGLSGDAQGEARARIDIVLAGRVSRFDNFPRTCPLIVERRDNESAERLLDRFKRVVQRSGILRDAKRKRHFISKSESRRLAKARSARRLRKNAAKVRDASQFGGRRHR